MNPSKSRTYAAGCTVLDISFPKSFEVVDWPMDCVVYVPFENFEYAPGYLMANEAFKSEFEARSHFWFAYPDKNPRIEKMTVKEFLSKSNMKGMNPFDALARAESCFKFSKEYNSTKEK